MQNTEKSVAVICEYNPFHYGHKYMISKLKESYGTVIGIMSGDFVQRGEVAVAEKYTRARAALDGGMDLILELPMPYCAASALDFATAGVRIACDIGVDALAFGREADAEVLSALAEAVAVQDFEARVADRIKCEPNMSYPRARQAVAAETLGDVLAEELAKPNNILALEYIAALKRENAALEICSVGRDMSFRSSSSIRAEGINGENIPFPQYFTEKARRLDYAERIVVSELRKGVSECYCVDKGLAALITKQARAACSLEELVQSCVGKTYTAARIRRAVLAAWLGIEAESVKARPAYTSLLAANEKGLAFLAKDKKTRKLPVVTKPSDYKKLPDTAQKRFLRALEYEDKAALCTEKLEVYRSSLSKTPTVLTNHK